MTEPHALRAEPLTAAAFAPFGRVLEVDPAAAAIGINQGFATRFHALAEVETEGAPTVISLFRSRARPLVAELLERHPHGTQAFFPLGGAPWLTVVAEGPTAPPRAFLCGAAQGVQIGRGVWHHPLLTLRAQDFVVVDRDDPGANLEEVRLDPAVPILL